MASGGARGVAPRAAERATAAGARTRYGATGASGRGRWVLACMPSTYLPRTSRIAGGGAYRPRSETSARSARSMGSGPSTESTPSMPCCMFREPSMPPSSPACGIVSCRGAVCFSSTGVESMSRASGRMTTSNPPRFFSLMTMPAFTRCRSKASRSSGASCCPFSLPMVTIRSCSLCAACLFPEWRNPSSRRSPPPREGRALLRFPAGRRHVRTVTLWR